MTSSTVPIDALRACVPLLPEEFRQRHERLLVGEHLERLATRLLKFHQQGVPDERPRPHFAAETTPPLRPIFAIFAGPLKAWEQSGGKADNSLLLAFVDALTRAGCANLLLLLGQRLTPASVTDPGGIPPTREQLLAAANKLHLDIDKLTVAGRALTKHVHRSAEAFWGEVKGSVEEKNALAVHVLERILADPTWWNVFGHFQHELVFEARVPTGHGARWGHGGEEFIGFLEPFDEEKCPTLH
jgi:hypothetical protein